MLKIISNPTDSLTLIPFLDEIEQRYFELPKHIVADAGYGSEQSFNGTLLNRKREALNTYNMYLKEQKKKYKQNTFNTDNWLYEEETDTFICPNQKRLEFQNHSTRNHRSGYQRKFKIYECEDCSDCPFRSSCTKAKEGNHR